MSSLLGLIKNYFFVRPPVYRKVVSRERCADGDHIELECGHRILLTHMPRGQFPCEECEEIVGKEDQKS